MKLLDGVATTATFSPCETYRYTLTRRWESGPEVVWIMLNPSSASAEIDDPTVRRCQTFARSWGYGAITVLNLFALRSTDPKALYAHPDPVGEGNDNAIREVVSSAVVGLVMAAWGVHGRHRGRDANVVDLVAIQHRNLAVLGLTKEGLPRHPLYVKGDVLPTRWM